MNPCPRDLGLGRNILKCVFGVQSLNGFPGNLGRIATDVKSKHGTTEVGRMCRLRLSDPACPAIAAWRVLGHRMSSRLLVFRSRFKRKPRTKRTVTPPALPGGLLLKLLLRHALGRRDATGVV